jgi:hypothetical protein
VSNPGSDGCESVTIRIIGNQVTSGGVFLCEEDPMRETILRTAVALILATALVACGDQPLQGMGERSGEWIGPLVHDVVLLPGSDAP